MGRALIRPDFMPLNTNDRANLSLQKLLDAPAPNLRYQGSSYSFLNGLTQLRGTWQRATMGKGHALWSVRWKCSQFGH